MSTSEILFASLKSTCTQSGNESLVASLQPPPCSQFKPLRSPLTTPAGEKSRPGNSCCVVVEEAVATPPFEASAKFVSDVVGVGVATGAGVGVAVGTGVGVGAAAGATFSVSKSAPLLLV